MHMAGEPDKTPLNGLVDMHIHTAPDVRPRLLDDLEAAQQAAQAGLRAIVFKSHVTCTADRATIARKVVPGIQVFGSVTLNDAVGGLNPAAVEAALQLGARIVWMPTISAQNHIVKHGGMPSGIDLLTPDGELQPALFDIFDLVNQHDAILATGHLSVPEIVVLVEAAAKAGVRKVVITHPEVPWVDMSIAIQQELRDLGAFFERCYVSTFSQGGAVPLARITSDIQQVGVASTVLTTDLGAVGPPAPVQGMRAFLSALQKEGFSDREIRVMAGETPAMLLGLG
jgi:hypothetical protein